MEIDIGFKRTENKKKYDRIWRKEYNKLTANIKHKLNSMRYRDKRRGHTICDYTYEELLHILSTNKCYYCGSSDNLGLDRIDNTKGHTKNNTIVCCVICNRIRMNIFTIDEMKKIGPFIRQTLLDRKEK